MQFKTAIFSALLTTFLSAFTATANPTPSMASPILKVTYDETYDNPSTSLFGVACSNGDNGLLTKGFTTFGSLPNFPYIGGTQFVKGWNSVDCGTCWRLAYDGRVIHVLAVDTAGTGFNIARKALDELSGGRAVELGSVDAWYEVALPSDCGL